MTRRAPETLASVSGRLIAALLPSATRAQTCAPSQIQVNHDGDLARDCVSGICVERACVDTLFRRITVCGHGFGVSPTVVVGGDALAVQLSVPASAASPCGPMDDGILAS